MQPQQNSFYCTQGNKKQLHRNTTMYHTRDEGLKLSIFLLNNISHFQSNLTDIVFTINVDFASLKYFYDEITSYTSDRATHLSPLIYTKNMKLRKQAYLITTLCAPNKDISYKNNCSIVHYQCNHKHLTKKNHQARGKYLKMHLVQQLL